MSPPKTTGGKDERNIVFMRNRIIHDNLIMFLLFVLQYHLLILSRLAI